MPKLLRVKELLHGDDYRLSERSEIITSFQTEEMRHIMGRTEDGPHYAPDAVIRNIYSGQGVLRMQVVSC
jgi:hypothetical protein